MEGEEYLFLHFWGQMMAFDMSKFHLTSGGIRGGVPVPTRLEPNKLILFEEEELPSGAGILADGSKLYLLGGKLPHNNEMISRAGISSTMYVADLSDPVVKFSKLLNFRWLKSLGPILMKKHGIICALSTDLYCDLPDGAYFDAYNPSSKRRTKLPIPPFFERSRFLRDPSCYNCTKWQPTGSAIVGDTLCVEVSLDYYFYNFDSMIWMRRPRYSNRLLHFIFYNDLASHLCHGKFVMGYEDILVSVGESEDILRAVLLPPIGCENENASGVPGFFYQPFTEVNQELHKLSVYHGRIANGMVLNLDRQKMCAIFQYQDAHCISKNVVYIFIFQVSKVPGLQPPLVTDPNLPFPWGSREITKDFISVTPLHKGLYQLDGSADDLPSLHGAFILRDRKIVSSCSILG